MKKRTKILIVVGTLIVVPLIALATLPVLFRDRIVARVKAEVNQAVEARVDWRDAGLSLFHDFPNLTLRLDDLSVAGARRFAGDTLAKVRRLEVVLDLASVLRNLRGGAPIVVRSVAVERPVVALKVLEDGTANWDITKESPAGQQPARPLTVSLRSLDIRDAWISLDDRKSRLVASLAGFRESLSGDFGADAFTMQTNAHADSVTLRFAGISYLNRVALDITAAIDADMRNKKFTFGKNEVRLNDLGVGFSGSATVGKENVALDLAFNAPRTEFRHILSLVPAIYSQSFQTLKTSGAVAVSGGIKGNYGKSAFPSFVVNAKVSNGAFQYPDLPLPARDIAVDLAVRNPGGSVDSTVARLDRFHAVIGRDPIDGAMVLRTPISDPDVDVRRTVKLGGVNKLAGRIDADVAVRTRMSFIDKKQYDRVTARGNVGVRDLALEAADLPHALAIDDASLQLTPQRAELKSLSGKIGTSDVRLSGHLENLIPFALRGDPLRGNATFSSQHLNLDEWRSDDSLTVIPVPRNIDFALQANVADLTYGKLKMTNARGGLRVKDQRATLENFATNTLGGEFGVNGFYETTDLAKPRFDVDLTMKNVDIPGAFAALTTVQTLAPVARFTQGRVSSDLHLSGLLGKNMMPLFKVIDGKGSLRTSELLLRGLPVLGKLADAVKLEQLRSPTLDSLRASIQIRDGRVHVNPFDVRLGKSTMRVSGSHGIDQSLQYTLALRVPRSELGADANRAIASLVSRAGKTGIDLQAAESVELDVRLGGTMTNPTVQTSVGDVVASTAQNVKEVAKQELAERVDSMKLRADSAAAEARRKAQAEAERLVAEAEKRAADIRAEAQRVAETVRREGTARADTLVARATSPLAKAAARPAADRLKKEANDRADQIVREADKRANDLVAEARKKAALLAPT
jgi:AsmA-like C-terminal region/AsmA family